MKLMILTGILIFVSQTVCRRHPKIGEVQLIKLTELKGHNDEVRKVIFSPDGRYLASVDLDRIVKIWDVATFGEVKNFGNFQSLPCVSFSPDGEYIAFGDSAQIKLLHIDNWVEIKTLKGGSFISFSPQGSFFVTAGNNIIKVWNTIAWDEIHTLLGFYFSFSPDERYFAVANTDSIKIIETMNWREVKKCVGWKFKWSPNGKYLVSITGEKTITIWDTVGFSEVKVLKPWAGVSIIQFAPDGRYLLVGNWRCLATFLKWPFDKDGFSVWETEAWTKVWEQGLKKEVWDIALSPSGKIVAFACATKNIPIFQFIERR